MLAYDPGPYRVQISVCSYHCCNVRPVVKPARDFLLAGATIDSNVLNGAALTILGSLHYLAARLADRFW